ncbi:MAG TPA: hypothetical protein V6C63_12815 [Allocoleopsis sp.]
MSQNQSPEQIKKEEVMREYVLAKAKRPEERTPAEERLIAKVELWMSL